MTGKCNRIWLGRAGGAIVISAALISLASSARADDWGTLKGRFLYDGAAPTPAALNIDKDPETCGKLGLVDESLVVGKGGELANIVIWVRDKKVKVHPDYKATDDARITLDNKGCHFVPHVLGVRVGQTLVIKNSDPISHNTHITGQNLETNPLIAAETSSDVSIDSPENLPAGVTCNIHGWMAGRLIVRPNPYFAVTDKDGKFEIKNLPAGELEFQIWHERCGYVTKANLGSSDATWDKGRVKWTIEGGKDTDLGDIKLSADQFNK